MRLITLPLSMLLLVLTLGGCLASGGHYSPSYGHGFSGYGYGYAPYRGYAHRPHRHSYRSWEAPRHYRQHHHRRDHSRPIFPHRPIWKKW
jgi:hypothetical protein